MPDPSRRPLWLSELETKTFPPGNHIIASGLLNRGSMLVIGGPPKSYKSFILNTILQHLACGTPLFGVINFQVDHPQRVLLLEQEVGLEDLQARFNMLMKALTLPDCELLRRNLAVYSCDMDMQLDTYPGVELISSLIKSVEPTVVAFDPLFEFHTREENSSTEMGKVMHGLDRLRQRFGVSLIINHHTSKPQEGSTREGPDLLRGSGVLYQKGDAFITLFPDKHTEGRVKATFKLRRAKPLGNYILQMNPESSLFLASSPDSQPASVEDEFIETI